MKKGKFKQKELRERLELINNHISTVILWIVSYTDVFDKDKYGHRLESVFDNNTATINLSEYFLAEHPSDNVVNFNNYNLSTALDDFETFCNSFFACFGGEIVESKNTILMACKIHLTQLMDERINDPNLQLIAPDAVAKYSRSKADFARYFQEYSLNKESSKPILYFAEALLRHTKPEDRIVFDRLTGELYTYLHSGKECMASLREISHIIVNPNYYIDHTSRHMGHLDDIQESINCELMVLLAILLSFEAIMAAPELLRKEYELLISYKKELKKTESADLKKKIVGSINFKLGAARLNGNIRQLQQAADYMRKAARYSKHTRMREEIKGFCLDRKSLLCSISGDIEYIAAMKEINNIDIEDIEQARHLVDCAKADISSNDKLFSLVKCYLVIRDNHNYRFLK
jgi:hypothetical protein